jgi:hypothetical protein
MLPADESASQDSVDDMVGMPTYALTELAPKTLRFMCLNCING